MADRAVDEDAGRRAAADPVALPEPGLPARAPASRPAIRILHVLPDLDMSGGQQVLRRLIGGMDRGRFEHFVCYFLPNHEMRDSFEAAGAQVLFLPRAGWWSAPGNLAAMVRFVRRKRIDIIHINGTPIDKIHGQLTALLCRRPLVSTLHGPRWRPGARWALLKHLVRENCERVLDPLTTDRVVAVSDSVLASWQPYLETRHVPPERMVVIRNGVPTKEFDRSLHRDAIATLRAEQALAGAEPTLVSVGRLDANKGHRFLITMMARVCEKWPAARLLIIGDGPLEAALRSQIAEAGLSGNVLLLGRRHDVPILLGLADVFVFASLAEGLPLAVLEAMAAGNPVVAFRLPALSDVVIEGVTGFQVEPGDVEALADRVVEVLGDRERAAKMGSAGSRRAVADYDLHRSIGALEAVYDEVARS